MSFMSGYIGIIEGEIGEVSDYHDSWEESGHELNAHINFSQEMTDLEGDSIARYGRAAEEELKDTDIPDVSSEEGIRVERRKRPEWVITKFWVVEGGENENFAVVKNAEGRFAFNLLEACSDAEISPVRFDLEEILSDFPGQWVGGFKKRDGRVQSGMLYGDEIEDDIEMGDPYRNTTNKSLIGPKIRYRGVELKVKVGWDGLVQIVSPGSYPREAYLQFVRDIMLNYASQSEQSTF